MHVICLYYLSISYCRTRKTVKSSKIVLPSTGVALWHYISVTSAKYVSLESCRRSSAAERESDMQDSFTALATSQGWTLFSAFSKLYFYYFVRYILLHFYENWLHTIYEFVIANEGRYNTIRSNTLALCGIKAALLKSPQRWRLCLMEHIGQDGDR